MYILSTTNGWNLGDDIIREGVYNILNINSDKSILWLNRSRVTIKFKEEGFSTTPQWILQTNYPKISKIIKYVDAFILAGTPEWGTTLVNVYKLCIKHKIPIYIVGVGMQQSLLAKEIISNANEKNLIKGATVRDRWAKEFLLSINIKAKWFFDPAFHANYIDCEKDDKIIFTPLLDKPFIHFYKKLYQKIRDKISLITVHEPYEYSIARSLFDKPVFYNSDYESFKKLYSSFSYYIGGRSHGSIPVIASGGFAHLFKHKKKQQLISMCIDKLRSKDIEPNIKIHPPNEYTFDKIDFNQEYDFSKIKEYLNSDLEKHRKYWKYKIEN